MKTRNRIVLAITVGFAAFGFVAPALGQDVVPNTRDTSALTPSAPLALFTPVAGIVDREAGAPHVRRSRAVRLEAAELAKLNPVQAEMRAIRLFDDVEVLATFKNKQVLADGTVTWTGSLDDHRFSSFVLAVVDGVIAGRISSVTLGDFNVRYLSNGVQVIRELNRQHRCDCGGALPTPPAGPNDPPVAALPQQSSGPGDDGIGTRGPGDDGSVIDLLVVYTNAARDSEGGTTAMRALIASSVADMNLRHSNSGTNTEFRVVHYGEVTYTESGSSSTDLSRLRSTDDGHMDIVHTWRNAYQADLVTLIADSLESGVAGRGYMPSATPFSTTDGFSVVRRTSADTGTMAHETGHNLGCHHHPDDDSGDGPASGDATVLPYAFGHRFYAGWVFRTTMAYDPDGFHVRIDYFSDPTRTYNAQPVGIEDERNNAAAIRTTRSYVANYRQSLFPSGVTWLNFGAVCPCTGTLIEPWDQLPIALATTPANGTVAIFSGSTPWTGVIFQPVTLRTWGSGIVEIGN